MTITKSYARSYEAVQTQLLAMRPDQAIEFGRVVVHSVLMGWDVQGAVYTSAGEATKEVLRLLNN